MLFLLALLAGFCHAQLDASCLQGEFEVNGRYTGQNIDMDYDASTLAIDGSDTTLTLQFTVPKRYTEQHEGNAFAITFHRKHQSTFNQGQTWDEKVVTEVEAEDNTSDAACYSNRYTNKTCTVGKNPDWTIVDSTENPTCVAFASVTVNWADVMKDTDALFGEVEVKDNGNNKEVFLTATVETWTHFREGDVGNTYIGVQTGREQLTNAGENSNNRKGEYNGDGGDKDVDFGLDRVIIDDERYTLYQIPFVLRFPKTVIVTETFDIVTDITILTAVSTQDIISLNLNPTGDETFGVLELTFTTEVQYPFGLIGPQQAVNGMKAYVGSDVSGGGTHAKSIEFVEFDDPGVCRALKETETCRQNFKVRIVPDNDVDPCSVAGDYTFEFWAECTSADDDEIQGCAIDDLQGDADDTKRRTSNAYGVQTVTVAHQDFCPTLMDEIRVTGDFHVYHDEAFEDAIVVGAQSDVFTNDILFFEATYRTTSLEDPITDFDTEDEGGDDSLIDYVRAQKIFLDVTIGDDREGNDLAQWNADWEENFKYTLGGDRIPGVSPGMDTAGGLTVTTGKDDGETKAVYNIVLCEVPYITPDVVQSGPKPDDCFTAPKDIAVDYLDFNKVTLSKGTANTIDENEVAFKLRLDERIIPVRPKLDFSYLYATIQAEIYYKGNLHPSRRLLQAPGALGANTRAQSHVMTTAFDVRRRNELEKCMVDNKQSEGFMQLQLTYANTDLIPKVSKSPDFAATLQMQLETFLGVKSQITVSTVAVGGKAIYSKGRGGDRRRLAEDANIVTVNLAITSGTSRAGKVMNLLQDELMNSRSKINLSVTAFSQAQVSKMQVRGCRGELPEDAGILRDDKLQSAAPGLTALFALVAAALVALC